MNRILLKAGFIALLALFGTLPSLADTFKWGDLWYETIDDSTCKVVRSQDGEYIGDVIIPSTATDADGKTYDVVAVAEQAFEFCYGVESVTISEGITHIEPYAFRWTGLNRDFRVQLPESLVLIDHDSFWNCQTLKTIVIPDNVETVGNQAFAYCYVLESAVIGASVKTIEGEVFANNKKLFKITIKAEEAPKCEANAFAKLDCDNIYLDIVAKNAAGYNAEPWSRFSNEDVVFVYDDIRYHITDRKNNICEVIAPADGAEYQGDITIPASVEHNGKPFTVESISANAFYLCWKVNSVTIEEGVKRIDDEGLQSCGLKSVILPESLESLGRKSFYHCHSLKTIKIPGKITDISEDAFISSGLESIEFGSSVKTIGTGAFIGCNSLISVTIPASITTIGRSAFLGCDALMFINAMGTMPPQCSDDTFSETIFGKADLVVPEGSVDAYKSADGWKNFGERIVLESRNFIVGDIIYEHGDDNTARVISGKLTTSEAAIPEEVSDGKNTYKVVEIADDVFTEWNYNVYTLIFPSTLKKIGNNVFSKFVNLKTVISKADVPPVCGDNVFYKDDYWKRTLWVNDAEAKEAYSKAEVWKDFSYIKTPEDLEFVYDDIRYRIIDLQAQTCKVMPRSNDDTSLQSRANDGTVYDKSEILIPAYTVHDGAKYRVVEIAEGAFRNCTEVTSVTLPATVTTIGSNAFENCGITEMTIPESVTDIKEETFKDCNNLAAVTIPARVETIGRGAFVGCEELMRITMEGSVPPTCEGNDYSQVFSEKTVQEATLVVPAGSTDDYDGANVWENFGNKTLTTTVDGISFEVSDKDAKTVTVTGFDADTYDGSAIPSTIEIDGATYTVTEIATGAFKDCAELTKLVIPASVKTIGDSAFAGCANLISVTALSETPTEIAGQAFDDAAYSTVMLAVPEGTAETYRQAGEWGRFVNIVDGASGIDGIEADGGEAVIYDLSGRRVKQPTAGFYIVNGRKVFIRR